MSFIYGASKKKILAQTLDLTAGTLYALPVTAGYSPDATAAAPTLADIPLGARSVTATAMQSLGARTVSQTGANASLTGGNVTFAAVPAGNPVVGVVIANGTGATAALHMYIDSFTNLPLTPDGRDVNVTFAGGVVVLF